MRQTLPMKISIIHPSRSRAELAFQTAISFIKNMSDDYDYEYLLSIDIDDPQAELYKKFFKTLAVASVISSSNRNAVQAVNTAAKFSKGDLLVVISDDWESFENWDKEIVQAVEGKEDFVLKTFDGAQKWIVTLPIMDRKYYQSHGFVYNPAFGHMFVDTHLTHVADLEKKLIIRNDIEFTHNHYSTGRFTKDAVSEKADLTWNSGMETYLTACKNKFGLGDSVDIYDLSPEALPHIHWLKSQLS